MSIFDEQAIEAAFNAYTNEIQKSGLSTIADRIPIALKAAEASLRERGMLRDGVGVDLADDWCTFTNPNDHNEVDFPVAIIRLPNPTQESEK